MTLIEEIKEAQNKKGYIVRYIHQKKDILEYYKIGRFRLDRLAHNVWKDINKANQSVSTAIVKLPPHGNTGKRSNNALSNEFDSLLKSFIDQLDSEPMPFNYISGQANVSVLPPNTDRNALYCEFIQFLFEKGVEETCAYSTFLQKVKQICPNFVILSPLEDVCDKYCKSRIALRGASKSNLTILQQTVFNELEPSCRNEEEAYCILLRQECQ